MRTERNRKSIPTDHSLLTAVLSVLAVALLALAVLLRVDSRFVRFYMYDNAEISVPYGELYVDPGVRAVSVGRLTGESPLELPVSVSGTVNTAVPGDYTITYRTSTMFRAYETERVVHVTDQTAPVIRLVQREGYRCSWLDGYEEEGYTAEDNVDGDLSSLVQVENRGEEWLYTVTDAAGNTGTAVRRIPYAFGRPELRLLGEETLSVPASYTYEDPGATALDGEGRDLSQYIHCDGEVIPTVPGEYELCYWLENARGDRVEAIRHVTVEPLKNPDVIDPEGKIIYLSFDDGPGPYTDRLLDILERYNVKASFFVTGLEPDYADCIGRAFREGHSIGAHSASHDYKAIYANEEAFFEDLNAVQELIHAQTGEYTALCRFPGGSSNTVSRFNRGIMSRLTQRVEEMGLCYFDWNVSSGDAGGTTDSDQVYWNIVEGCAAQRVSLVLQHDNKDFSVDAVEKVIQWGLLNGYAFAPLDSDSPTMHHRIAN